MGASKDTQLRSEYEIKNDTKTSRVPRQNKSDSSNSISKNEWFFVGSRVKSDV